MDRDLALLLQDNIKVYVHLNGPDISNVDDPENYLARIRMELLFTEVIV